MWGVSCFSKKRSTAAAQNTKHKTPNIDFFFASLLLFALVSCFELAAQTTQPSAEVWQAYVQSIDDALIADTSNDTLAQLIPDAADIAQFDTKQTETRFRLAHRVNHMSVLWQHVYTAVPGSLVTDLSNDLSGDTTLSPELRKKLVPKDAAAISKADSVAQKWIARELAPDSASWISVVLFWERPPEDHSPSLNAREPVFVLMRGSQTAMPPTVLQIRYGDMSQALN